MAGTDDSDDITELIYLDPERLDAVGNPANGASFLLLKSVAVKRSAKADRKAPRKKVAGSPYSAVRADKKVKRGRIARSVMTAKAASSGEIPATNCPNESASILAAVTGSRPDGMCSARTINGSPCMRPAGRGGTRCHLHM